MVLRPLTITEISGPGVVTVAVDEDQPVETGGYGAIYTVDGIPNIVVKRLDVDPPKPLTAIREYTAHITVTRQRLESILKEEKRLPAPRAFIIEFITEILAYSLSTHCTCDLTADMQIRAVWLLQQRASGKSLWEHFRVTRTPTPFTRRRIAKHFLRRMRTLRRADLVHLDCVPRNIFYDYAIDKLTMIDLDGCGIVSRSHGGESWDYPPVTLGRLREIRLPPWYPQPGVLTSPRRGNYVFAERWVVLDTLIRILTWDKVDILGWVEDSQTRSALGNAYKSIAVELEAFRNANADNGAAFLWWNTAWQERLRALSVELRNAMPHQEEVYWADRGHPTCMAYFADVAQEAFFEPQALSTSPGTAPLYDVFSKRLGNS